MMTLWQEIQFRNPWWLLLALQPGLLWLLALLRSRRRRDDFADPALLPWVRGPHALRSAGQWWRGLLVVAAWACLALAMAGPRLLQGVVAQAQAAQPRLELVVDLSYSMSARDIAPSRLQRVKLELRDLVARLQRERVGLIVYAARAHVMLPATSDRNVLTRAIDLLRIRELPSEGSNLYAGLQLARDQLRGGPGHAGAILLLSDGGLSDDGSEARQRLSGLVSGLRGDNIDLYTFGIGTSQGAALLDAQQGWLQSGGKPVITRLHAALLQKLADEGNGKYTEVTDDNSDWQSIYDNGIARRMALLEKETRQRLGEGDYIWRDLSPWFVLPGSLLLLLAALRLPRLSTSAVPVLLMSGLLLSGTFWLPQAHAAGSSYADGIALYRAGKYAQAASVFAALPGYAARMAEADSHYHRQQYARAAATYIQSVLDANSDSQRSAALFNLANSYFKQRKYARAADTYRDALHYQPDFAAAKVNLAYARDLLQRTVPAPPAGVNRAGTGYHMAPVAPGTDVGKGRVSIGEDVTHAQQPTAKPQGGATPQTSDSLRLQLVEPASSRVELDRDPQWTYDIRRAGDIRPRDSRFMVDESVFWQRLFESEEDYPAPRMRPETLPGVAPW